MTKVILICGKICSGKSTYAAKLRTENKAVLLSCDEITLALFDQQIGENHDLYVERIQNYLFKKSLEIVESDISVILDWGFWTKEERNQAKTFYKSHGIVCEFHYLDISDEIWKSNLQKRNNAIREGRANAYYVDENLARKFDLLFEVPNENEIDVRYQNNWLPIKK